jgi:hypothetical protein
MANGGESVFNKRRWIANRKPAGNSGCVKSKRQEVLLKSAYPQYENFGWNKDWSLRVARCACFLCFFNGWSVEKKNKTPM